MNERKRRMAAQQQDSVIKYLQDEIVRLRVRSRQRRHATEQHDLLHEALHGEGANGLREMIHQMSVIVYTAVSTCPTNNRAYDALYKRYEEQRADYISLVQLCAAKRPYLVPPEYSGILDVGNLGLWSPTDCEVARVFVSITLLQPAANTLYADIASRLDAVMPSVQKAHIYRSLRRILKHQPERGGVIRDVKLR